MIYFLAADVMVPLRNRIRVRQWLTAEAERAGYSIISLNYIYCSDDFLLQMNRDYLKHDYYTDIITFPISEGVGVVEGECYVSVDRIRENAKELGTNFADELHRVMIHGLLHLMGQGDKSEEEAIAMRIRENEALTRRTFHVEHSKTKKN
ncbi:MAG: rRNA maturation RNase YbeY [Bacteroidia bacterium]